MMIIEWNTGMELIKVYMIEQLKSDINGTNVGVIMDVG